MLEFCYSTFTMILGVAFILGNLGNGFIALVNCIDWVKRRKMSSVDQILTALAISRIALLWIVLFDWWVSVTFPGNWITKETLRLVYITRHVSSHFSIWLATGLSIYYFLKIASFSNSNFLYLKFRVKKVVSVTLMVSLVFLFTKIVLLNTHIDFGIDGYKTNMSHSSTLNHIAQFSKIFLFTNTVFTSIPFLVSLITFLLLITSLWKHHKKMQQSGIGSRDSSTMAHIKALQMVIASLLLYTIFFVLLFIKIWSFNFLEKNMAIFLSLASGITAPSGHSFVLIFGNSKLRQTSLSVLWRLRCRCKGVRHLGP
uniref:Taste receptor type 2 n=1 Tax=Castor canadensis TaxID=51338 RepID=A0A8C0WKA7_CASCN